MTAAAKIQPDRFAGLDPCVHCGFCLQACPTFLATGDEADSPRGRIVLMQALNRGTLPANDPLVRHHLDRCLGCRACETACPSGVAYGHALEAARDILEKRNAPPWLVRIVLTVMAEPRIRRPALTLSRWFRPLARFFAGRSRIGFGLASLAATRRTSPPLRPPPPSSQPSKRSAVIFTGCIMEGLFGHVHRATDRTLRHNGFSILPVPGQGCCGALHAHAGRRHEAVALAAANVVAFRTAPRDVAIAVNSAGCGAMLREYGDLLADHPLRGEAQAFSARVRDVSELLADAGPRPGAPVPVSVAYDPPCHLHHAQRVVDAPERVLGAIPGLRRVHHRRADACCGSAGLYSLQQSRLSRRILDAKIAALTTELPDVVVTGNPGCAMHIGAGLLISGAPTRVMHPVELLAWSYDRLDATPRPEAAEA